MVQRAKSVGKKLGIQADHVKSEKLSSSLKPSVPLHQDGKTKGADYFKRKIKKSRSLSLDGFNPSSPRRKMSSLPNVETPPRQSQPPAKARHVLPNYMKPTSSSDARKENSQVAHLQSTPAVSVSRRICSTGSPRPRHNSCAGKYSPSSAARNLKRSSSLKLVRTLTKARSLKPARSTSAKKCSRVVVCSDLSIQKATCSSTQKETKYPEYIMLNPGGTEAEGTSVFKVCPYTYCSLNGHRDAQLPPLKRFVAARRRLLKAQKSAKVVPVSPASFCQGRMGDKPACIKLDFENDFFIEIYAKDEKGESLKIDEVVCVDEDEVVNFSEEGEDDHRSSPSDEGRCRDGMTGTVAYDKHGDVGQMDGIDHDKHVENCRDPTEMVINSGYDVSQEKEETVVGDLDEVYSLIMIQKERMHPVLSHCDVDGDDLLEGAEDIDVFLSDTTDDGRHEEDYSSSELDEGETLSITETEDGCDKVSPNNEYYSSGVVLPTQLQDTVEYEEDKKQEEKEHFICTPRIQEDGVDCASDHSTPSQVSDVLSETMEAAGVAEIEGLVDECTQTESGVSLEEIDGEGDIRAQTVSTSIILQTQFDEAGVSNSEENACLEPSQGLEEEIQVTAELLTYTESIIAEEVRVQDEEETRAYEQPSDAEIPTHIQIPGTSSEDSGEVDGSITTLEFARRQENDESSLLVSTRLDGSGDDDNLEGFWTGEPHQSEDHLVQSEKVNMNNAAEPTTACSSVQNGIASMSNKTKDMYLRRKGKSHEELSGPYIIWRINRREKCDIPDEEQQGFNPRDPNYLPIVPDPEGEKVDLRHQMIDDRRNSEEWMIDHALQRAVSKLAPARKKKVELLVEAFEKVMPVSQFETNITSSSTGITQVQPIQACS